jgi:hypothetical protein
MAQGISIGASPSGPRPGDVVVSRSQAPGLYYTLAQLPARPQLTAPTRDRAMELARSFARKHRVDVWHVNANAADLVDTYRGSRDGARRTDE